MAFAQRLEIRQGQGLVMTPQLQQAIKLLQLSNLELQEFVAEELEKNPLLEREREEEAPEPAREEAPERAELSLDGAGPAEGEFDADYADVNPEARAGDVYEAPADAGGAVDWSKAGAGGGSLEDLDGFENRTTREKSLHEHLFDQLAMATADPATLMIGGLLIDATDEAGYLRADLDEMAQRLGCARAQIEAVLALCHTFEPTGVMARDVRECLMLQLAEQNRLDPMMQALLDNLDRLARRDFAGLMQACACDAEDMADMVAELRALTPKPGAAFGGETAPTVEPDVFVKEGPHGTWLVELNSDTLPKVLMNQRYYAEVNRTLRNEAERTYLQEQAQTANWLVKSLDQRARTILKVAREIVRQQDGFLAYGVAHLRPLNLKSIATVIDMHESTVSRVTSNKYISTPRGVFELKYFFTAALGSAEGGEAHSAEAVRHRIKSLIDEEPAAEPLSDDRIVELLREAGVEIARRTVAKYREAMRIPSSLQRKRDLLKAG